jgi:hypothetical protein
LRRKGAECDDDFGLDELELPNQVRTTRDYFFRPGISIPRRTVLQHVHDEDLLPRQLDRAEDLRK